MSQPGERSHIGPVEEPDRYELVERRAAGGEGEVWQAVEYHGGQPFSYAVKIIDLADGDQADDRLDKLRLQAALATQLEHPALVKVKEVFVGAPPHPTGAAPAASGRRLYFVMKWIEGSSLQEALESGRIRGLDVLAPLEPIAEAIDYLHAGRDTNGAMVLHRDVKPANVLLADDGRVYLVDFGLVRFHSTTATSRIFGTAPFMAPESLARGEYTPATDRYTLGATVYYALTGEMPIPGDIAGMTSRLTAALGPGQDRVVRGVLAMLAISPDARPASAAAWLRALRTAPPETTAGKPIVPPTTFGRPRVPPPQSPPTGPPVPPPLSPPTGYPRPPVSMPLGPPSGYPPMPGGFPGAPKKKSSTGKILAWVGGGLAVVLVGLCCLNSVSSLLGNKSLTSGDSSSSPSAKPVDRSVPPPEVTTLEPVLVSVADVLAATKVRDDFVSKSSDSQALHGGLTKLQLCAEKAVNADALGAYSSNAFSVSMDGYPTVASAVGGFYGTAAKDFFASARTTADRCGWKQFTVPKLGQDAFGVYLADGNHSTQAAVFVLSGQVVYEVTMRSTYSDDSYQTYTVRMASAMVNRLPK